MLCVRRDDGCISGRPPPGTLAKNGASRAAGTVVFSWRIRNKTNCKHGLYRPASPPGGYYFARRPRRRADGMRPLRRHIGCGTTPAEAEKPPPLRFLRAEPSAAPVRGPGAAARARLLRGTEQGTAAVSVKPQQSLGYHSRRGILNCVWKVRQHAPKGRAAQARSASSRPRNVYVTGPSAFAPVPLPYPRSISAKASRALRACSWEGICWSASTARRGIPASSSIRLTGT